MIGSGLLGVNTAWALKERGARGHGPRPGRWSRARNLALPMAHSLRRAWPIRGIPRGVLEAAALARARGLTDAPADRGRCLRCSAGDCGSFVTPIHATTGTTRCTTPASALYSLQALHELRSGTRIEYAGATLGTLRLFRHGTELENALDMVDWLGQPACGPAPWIARRR